MGVFVRNGIHELEGGDKGAAALVVDWATAFEKVQLSVVWHWAMQIGFPHRVRRVPCGYVAHA